MEVSEVMVILKRYIEDINYYKSVFVALKDNVYRYPDKESNVCKYTKGCNKYDSRFSKSSNTLGNQNQGYGKR